MEDYKIYKDLSQALSKVEHECNNLKANLQLDPDFHWFLAGYEEYLKGTTNIARKLDLRSWRVRFDLKYNVTDNQFLIIIYMSDDQLEKPYWSFKLPLSKLYDLDSIDRIGANYRKLYYNKRIEDIKHYYSVKDNIEGPSDKSLKDCEIEVKIYQNKLG